MDRINKIRDKKIAIIGATGFIGGRLFEILKEHGVDPLVILRSYSKAFNLSRYKYNDILCDLNDYEQLVDALDGIDICFNCAHDFSASQENMVKSISNLAKACSEKNIRLVHLSSVAVHEPMSDLIVNEESQICDKKNFYGYTKFLIEKELLNHEDLDVIILRPTNVYGPFSGAWTVGPCMKLLSGKVMLTDNAKDSINNLIFIDDLCNYMILAADLKIDNRDVVFLVNGPDKEVSWSKFYEDYSKLVKSENPSYMDENIIIKNNGNFLKFLINGFKNISMYNDNPLTLFIINNLKKLPNSFKSKLKAFQKDFSPKLGEIILYPNSKEISDYKNQSFVDSSRAIEKFKYTPLYDYKKGIEKTSVFVKWYFEKSKIS